MKIVSVANTKITGNIVSSQITSVANTQITGTITGSQISSNTLSNTVFQTGSVENYLRGANLDFGMRNRIINGAMVIDQRNAGASITPTNGQYSLDRWICVLTQASKFTVQQNAGSVTLPAGFANYLGVTSSSAYSIVAGDLFYVAQLIEGYNVADLAWGTASASSVTLSFKVYSSLTGTFGGALQNSANARSYPFTYTVSSANTWTTISVTIAGDTSGTWLTTTGIGIRVFFGLGVGSTYSGTAGAWAGADYRSATGATSVVGTNGATFYITGVQLEKGSTATSFDYRPYGTELVLCQRYFQRFGGNSTYETYAIGQAYNTTNVWATIPLKVNMRANPTFSPTSGANLQLMNVSGTGLNCTACDIAYGSTTSPDLFPVVASGLVAGNASVFRSAGTTSGFISFSAEL